MHHKTTQGTEFSDRNELPHFCFPSIFWCFSSYLDFAFLFILSFPPTLEQSIYSSLAAGTPPQNPLHQDVNFDSEADMLRQNSEQANLQANKVLCSLGTEYHCSELNNIMTTRWIWLQLMCTYTSGHRFNE